MPDPTKRQVARFRRLCHGLLELIQEIQRDNPAASYYLADDNLHLMKGPSHGEDDGCTGTRARQDNSVEEAWLGHGAGGGDW
jgi:hypothetical protein